MAVLSNSNRGAEKVDSLIDSKMGFCQISGRKRLFGKRIEENVEWLE